ncbi:MAG: hypothetical protein MZU95_14385 [Desulfomicrobium escambiense]|nr:hypothetical protein [Desulfomicrobium escambiense]
MVEKRQRVAHAAFREGRDLPKRLFFGGDVFLQGDLLKLRADLFGRDRLEVEPLATGMDRQPDLPGGLLQSELNILHSEPV